MNFNDKIKRKSPFTILVVDATACGINMDDSISYELVHEAHEINDIRTINRSIIL